MIHDGANTHDRTFRSEYPSFILPHRQSLRGFKLSSVQEKDQPYHGQYQSQ
ncbi:Hypothetical protein GbCGDNIH3_7002 [Granulibacter bethesdensis]|uniref:Uncharacterized protein n=1 Tax=Granulibacter bethesdensis TaxID=364410 RepID=A0AAN0REP4_9PROT|nr:Hypothetical protein GbCGDNIH3_7002 [Granulibacter bethesdensis]